jgi:hypothetical protein
MDTGYTSNLTLALNSQYFPGASTSPYGPCLTLPGTVGSYYSQNVSALNTTISSLGFTIEAWVNYPSLANAAGDAGINRWYPFTLSKMFGNNNPADWLFGATPAGALSFYVNTTSPFVYPTVYTANNIIQTGQWNHIMVQCNGSNIYCALNGTFQNLTGSYSPAGSGTIAPAVAPVTGVTNSPITHGQYNNGTGPNVSIAKARIVLGTSGANGNVYSSGNFTPNPNFNQTLPAGATVAWSLDTQYPLPTYPSIQDVTPLPAQTSSFGSLPAPVGGVTSNVLSPYSTTYPQLDSIRFDGTGYIDYGNAATSVLTTNIWASNWTIEGWVYLNSYPNTPVFVREPYTTNSGSDFAVGLNSSGVPYINSNGGVLIIAGTAIPLSTWTHLAITYDGAKSNIYQGTSGTSSTVASATPSGSNMIYTPTSNFRIGGSVSAGQIVGNLADVRVSNVARYTGSTYTVPNVADGSAPFVTDRNTLLLLKSLAGQTGTTLEVQGRGLNAVSLGATRSVQSYPPAPMSSYLLDTTSNASVTYGQGKYVASASSEYFNGAYPVWAAFDKSTSLSAIYGGGTIYSYWTNGSQLYSATTGLYTGPLTTVDTLGNAYLGEWLQLQVPVSTLLSNYVMSVRSDYVHQSPSKFWILGSRDGLNWTLMDSRSGISWASATQTFTVCATQAYNLFRVVVNSTTNGLGTANFMTILEWTLNGTEESLCITSDAKVGVGIANPQRALEVAGDLVVSGTISGGAGLGSFRNRIINGDMRIAQRGVGPTNISLTVAYQTIDRWGSYVPAGGVITVSQRLLTASDTPWQLGFSNSYAVTVVTGATTGIDDTPAYHNIEGYNTADFRWGSSFGQPVTLSFWFRTNLPSGSVLSVPFKNSGGTSSYISTVTTIGANTWQYATATIPPPPNGTTWLTTNGVGINMSLFYFNNTGTTFTGAPNTWLSGNYVTAAGAYNWAQNAGNYIELTGVQLEKGTVATGFEFRPFAQELALCQRYYQVFGPGNTSGYNRFAAGVSQGTTFAYLSMPTIVTMRAAPTLSSNSAVGTFQINQGATNPTPTSFGVQDSSPTNIGLTVNTTGLTAGYAAVLVGAGSTAAFVAVTAEL